MPVGAKVSQQKLRLTYVETFIFGITSGWRGELRFIFTYNQKQFSLKSNDWKHNGKPFYSKDLSNDTAKVNLAKEALDKIPKLLFEKKGSFTQYGSCAPCVDGTEANIYFKLSDGTIKEFVINPRSTPKEGVPKVVSDYAKFISKQARCIHRDEYFILEEMFEKLMKQKK